MNTRRQKLYVTLYTPNHNSNQSSVNDKNFLVFHPKLAAQTEANSALLYHKGIFNFTQLHQLHFSSLHKNMLQKRMLQTRRQQYKMSQNTYNLN